jgi:hypothetical protein
MVGCQVVILALLPSFISSIIYLSTNLPCLMLYLCDFYLKKVLNIQVSAYWPHDEWPNDYGVVFMAIFSPISCLLQHCLCCCFRKFSITTVAGEGKACGHSCHRCRFHCSNLLRAKVNNRTVARWTQINIYIYIYTLIIKRQNFWYKIFRRTM